MTIAFKVDEDLPREIAPMLRTAGFDALSVLDQELGGAPDSRVWEISQQEKRCVITADKGFAETSRHTAVEHSGIMLLRLPRESRQGYIDLVERLVRTFELDSLDGAIVSVSPDAIRVYRRGT